MSTEQATAIFAVVAIWGIIAVMNSDGYLIVAVEVVITLLFIIAIMLTAEYPGMMVFVYIYMQQIVATVAFIRFIGEMR